MAAMFGAASHACFSLIVFAFEVARDYNSVLPLMVAAVIAEGVVALLMPNTTIMIEKLRRRCIRFRIRGPQQEYCSWATTRMFHITSKKWATFFPAASV
jgi:H+/Cl- antiporter ClcA